MTSMESAGQHTSKTKEPTLEVDDDTLRVLH